MDIFIKTRYLYNNSTRGIKSYRIFENNFTNKKMLNVMYV